MYTNEVRVNRLAPAVVEAAPARVPTLDPHGL
jgi:hypothetical protein